MENKKETPIDTAIRYLHWWVVHEYSEGKWENMNKGDFYNLKRAVEILKELRGKE